MTNTQVIDDTDAVQDVKTRLDTLEAYGVVGSGNAPPTTGNYAMGAKWLNKSPTIGGYIGWVCTVAGTPGTWRPYGKID